ncbi:MAG: Flp pilus assembly complex ATPase component TadA [Clostridiales bacterium]|jgi:pilus assembly protein CpaF|nr:Flp pilus assembly complex ATPase component TadA [Clostridiales bacterium]
MLTINKIRELQENYMLDSKPNVKVSSENIIETSLTLVDAVKKCQSYIAANSNQAFREERSETERLRITKELIDAYVWEQKPVVQRPKIREIFNWNELREALKDEITNYGPLTSAIRDETIDEIRANGPYAVFIEKDGKSEIYERHFNDNDHMERIIAKLIGVSKVRLTPKNPMVNARTIEGYRVNATHSSISPYNEPAFVLRKFSKRELVPEEMMKTKSFSKNMYTLLSLIPKADLSWITVGGTGSGKTTLNELLVREISANSRIITIENPSEMRLIRRENNKIVNDVLQYESVPDDDDSSPATMENLFINALRQSPHWIGPGELRTPGEFATALRAAQTGHYFFTTLHAEGDEEAIYRFLTSYLMTSHEPAHLALRNICSAVKFVIFQEKLADGSRKVTSISEVLGATDTTPIMQQIYKFDPIDSIRDPVTKEVVKIIGNHKRVGAISKKTQERMIKAGIEKNRFALFATPPSQEGEVEEY